MVRSFVPARLDVPTVAALAVTVGVFLSLLPDPPAAPAATPDPAADTAITWAAGTDPDGRACALGAAPNGALVQVLCDQ